MRPSRNLTSYSQTFNPSPIWSRFDAASIQGMRDVQRKVQSVGADYACRPDANAACAQEADTALNRIRQNKAVTVGFREARNPSPTSTKIDRREGIPSIFARELNHV